jgi:hypothetical protein
LHGPFVPWTCVLIMLFRYFNNIAAAGAIANAAEPKLDKMFDELRSEWMTSLVPVLHGCSDYNNNNNNNN